MEAIAYDDFSGTGTLESRNTSYKADQRWVRVKLDDPYKRGMVLSDGAAIQGSIPDDVSTVDGYWLVQGVDDERVILQRPFTIVVECTNTADSGRASVSLGVPLPGGTYSHQSSMGVSRYGGKVGNSGSVLPNSQLSMQGTLSPQNGIIGNNQFVMSVAADGSVAYAVNGYKFGISYAYQVQEVCNIAITLGTGASIRSVAIYDGFLLDPPITPPDPPSPPFVGAVWWHNEQNAILEPV